MKVKICIVGCGAIGSIFGAHLARLEDVEVHAYDVWKEHTRAITERGLRISGAADFTARLHATSDPHITPVFAHYEPLTMRGVMKISSSSCDTSSRCDRNNAPRTGMSFSTGIPFCVVPVLAW